MRHLLGRGLRAFVHFWSDFLFGDTPVLAPATLAIVGVAYGLRHERAAAVVLIPVLVAGLIGTTAYLGRRRPEKEGAPSAEREPEEVG